MRKKVCADGPDFLFINFIIIIFTMRLNPRVKKSMPINKSVQSSSTSGRERERERKRTEREKRERERKGVEEIKININEQYLSISWGCKS